MKIKNVFFDLDGTLLPMDQDLFVKVYFKNLGIKLAPYGYDPKLLIDGIWKGTAAMVHNDGTKLNEEVFWSEFARIFGEKVYSDLEKFDDFYRNEFDAAKEVCGFNPMAKQTVSMLRSSGVRVALATNPIFPAVATQKRIRWAGLEPSDFELYTTYENTGFCKPNLDYYRDMLGRLNMKADETLMVGNDVSEDMVAAKLGMDVFLLTDCLINKEKLPLPQNSGSFDELIEYLKSRI